MTHPVKRRLLARPWFALTALVVAVGMVIQLSAAEDATGGFFTEPSDKVLNTFSYFTVQSNLIVGVTSLLLAIRTVRPSTVFRTFRLMGLVGIALTFVVFHAVLRDLQDLTGQAAVADFLLHTVSPILCVVGWVLFGPRRQISVRIVELSVLYPLVWGIFTMIRGELVGFYPYPFMNVTTHGYARVAVNLALVGAVFIALAFGAYWWDRRLASRRWFVGAGGP